jgi:hypothetical protein
MKVSTGTQNRLQFASSSSLAIITGAWGGTAAINGSAAISFDNSGTVLSSSTFTDCVSNSLATNGDTIFTSFQDVSNSRIYRIMACKTSLTTAAMIAERLI